MANIATGVVNMLRAVIRWMGGFFTRNSWAIGVFGLVSGLIAGIAVPLWINYWLPAPSLTVEINAISREIPKSVRLALDEYSEFSVLAPAVARVIAFEGTASFFRPSEPVASPGVTLEQLGRLIESTKREAKELPNRIPERKQQVAEVEALTEEQLTFQRARQLNAPLSPEVTLNPTDFERKRENVAANRAYFRDLLDQFKQKYRQRLSVPEKRAQDIEQKLPLAERRFDTLKTDLLQTRSILAVTAAFTNSGRSSISIKRVGLLRVYIGAGNYVDIRLTVAEYEKTAQVTSQGTQIASLVSPELLTLLEGDRTLINTYWGQSVRAILFVEDTLGKIHASNRIPFAGGLYEKIIYDRLAAEASKHVYTE